MNEGATKPTKSATAFRIVSIAALIAAIGQITLGGTVRVTGSGDACPDWPLCHGQIIPPFDYHVILEYSHRVTGSVLGILILVAVFIAWRYLRDNRPAKVSTAAAFLFVVAAGVLGGATVLTELTWWVRLIHLSIAELTIASIAVMTVAGWPSKGIAAVSKVNLGGGAGTRRLVIASLVGVFLLILYGSYIVGMGYGSSCSSWPLCNDSLMPEGRAYMEHMGHRYLSLLIGIVLGYAVVQAYIRGDGNKHVRMAALLAGGAFVFQTGVGAALVWSGFATQFKAIHLSMATLVWVALVYLAVFIYASQGVILGARKEKPLAAKGLERATT
ncbi:MAG: heme A synthase [SAR202 cluster bacterium]|nr:heme A synthase [SAR202 cluster bacterium]